MAHLQSYPGFKMVVTRDRYREAIFVLDPPARIKPGMDKHIEALTDWVGGEQRRAVTFGRNTTGRHYVFLRWPAPNGEDEPNKMGVYGFSQTEAAKKAVEVLVLAGALHVDPEEHDE